MTTRARVTVALGTIALILAIIFAVSPHTTSVAGRASSDTHSIDIILGISKNADMLPDQQYPTH
jgi:hypothetical protein